MCGKQGIYIYIPVTPLNVLTPRCSGSRALMGSCFGAILVSWREILVILRWSIVLFETFSPTSFASSYVSLRSHHVGLASGSSVINKSLVDNNKALLGQISKVVADSGWNTSKRSSVQVADEQLREIKKPGREEPKSFKRQGNKIHSSSSTQNFLTRWMKLNPTLMPKRLVRPKRR